MAEHVETTVRIVDSQTLNDFIGELKKRPAVRLVKVADQGSVEPSRRGGAIVMQPRVRVVATAYDPESREIIRWERKWDVGSGTVTVDAVSGRGRHRDAGAVHTKQDIVDELEVEQYQVAPGEWTPQLVGDVLERRRAQ